MPEYLAPGVYIEEIEIGAKPIEGVSTSTAGFLGQTERGPTAPRLVTSFDAFQWIYGGFIENSYLAYAVQGFFANGGRRCFIGRIVAMGATGASAPLTASGENSQPISVMAIGPGPWGNRVRVKVEDAALQTPSESDLFKLTVEYLKRDGDAKPAVSEVYDNLSINPASSDYYKKRVNSASNLITLQHADNSEARPVNQDISLEGGGESQETIDADDYKGENADPLERTGLSAFESIDEISMVCIPDENEIQPQPQSPVRDALKVHCETMKDRFAILQSSRSPGNVGALIKPVDSKYAAFYYPWIKIQDPVTNSLKSIPPGGHIAGVYARVDQERGVHKAPANEVLRGVSDLEVKISKGDQDILNPRNINCIRAFPGRGIRIWGARTTSSDALWKYVNVRRLFLFLEESIDEGTQWAVFEPNDEKLWARVKQSISQFLTRVWRDGALMGTTQEEAFFVRCDRTTMTQDDIDNGRLIVLIGVAPVKPAEFVIFRIAQVARGSELSE